MFNIKQDRLAIGQKFIEFNHSPNVGAALVPEILVIHYTASGPNADIAKYFSQNSAKVSAHLVIRRDGTVIQCVPFNEVAWHAGKSRWVDRNGKKHVGLNQSAIGIEIENWGPLTRSGSGWLSWKNQSVDAGKVIEARHKSGGEVRGWETFTAEQVDATIAAARAICQAYTIVDIVGHDDIAPGRKTDPGPAWPMASFKARVLGRADDDPPDFVVRSATGLNIRSGPGAASSLLRPAPLPDGTRVVVHDHDGPWRYVSVLNAKGDPDYSGWVHGSFLTEA